MKWNTFSLCFSLLMARMDSFLLGLLLCVMPHWKKLLNIIPLPGHHRISLFKKTFFKAVCMVLTRAGHLFFWNSDFSL